MTSYPMKLTSSSTASPITIRVLAASTGVTYRIALHPAELTWVLIILFFRAFECWSCEIEYQEQGSPGVTIQFLVPSQDIVCRWKKVTLSFSAMNLIRPQCGGKQSRKPSPLYYKLLCGNPSPFGIYAEFHSPCHIIEMRNHALMVFLFLLRISLETCH